jgi:hypothetical protein
MGMSAVRAIPVDPDGPLAQEWLRDELAKPEYEAARPTWFDRLATTVYDWLGSLDVGGDGGPPGSGLLIILVIVAVVVIVAFLIFGLPRINRRSRITGTLFGDDDARTAASMRADGEAAARAGDYATAIAELFRSIARGLAERSVLTTTPGTTAHDFATRAGRAFSDHAIALDAAAIAFDAVRYQGGAGSAEQYEAVAALELALRAAKPTLTAVGA